MKNKLRFAISSVSIMFAMQGLAHAEPKVTVLDKTHMPAGNFLAYTEFELSGEPLAEALGLDLDMLDPDLHSQPTAFDFSAGIESYEYSEEAMYALNYQSTMGPHIANGPQNAKRGGKPEDFTKRIAELAQAVGISLENTPRNLYPISLPYYSGIPELGQQADMSAEKGNVASVLTASGKQVDQHWETPAYQADYKTLAWDASRFDKTINPAALGGILLKEVMWLQDFLGGMHITKTDEEVVAESSKLDQDGAHSQGVSAADGFNGMLLTELSIDKLLILQNQLGFDGKTLGAAFTPAYDPSRKPIWFAHKVAVNEGKEQGKKHGLNTIESLAVTDGSSQLEDVWLMLWPVSEYFAFTDQRQANKTQNPAFLSVFDGAPFAASPSVNIDQHSTNDIAADDAFSLVNNIGNLLFKNLSVLHFNQAKGTFVTEYANGKQGNKVSTFDSAYSIVALSIFQRAQDALPVGYSSAEGGSNLKTEKGQAALTMIKAQADFIVDNLIAKNGLVNDGLILGGAVNTQQSLATQFAAIRGLVSAFLATENAHYKTSARNIYLAVEKQLFDKGINTWAEQPGKATIHTPYTAAAISGGLREIILHLKNEEGEHNPALELARLTERYASWFKGVINGGMQLAEWLGDTGEHMLKNNPSVDSDEDGVLQLTAAGGKFGTAMVMANKVKVE